MRLIVLTSYWPRISQVHQAYFEVEQVRELAKQGCKINVLIPRAPWESANDFYDQRSLDLDSSKIQISKLMVPRLPELIGSRKNGVKTNIIATGVRIKHYLRYCGHTSPVIVHGERNVGISASIWNSNNKRKAVMIIHGRDPVLDSLPNEFLKSEIGTKTSGSFNNIIVVGNRLQDYAKKIGYMDKKIRVIPNGLPSSLIHATGVSSTTNPVRLIVATRLIKIKGIDYALKALAQIHREDQWLDWQFDIYGEGPERANLEIMSARLGLTSKVHFHGAVSNRYVFEKLSKSSIFLLPSWNEAFGIAYLEAMAMGLAVVGCHENGAADIITDGIDGCLVPPHDVDTLSALIKNLILNPTLRASLGQAAVKSVRRFSWRENTKRVLEALHA